MWTFQSKNGSSVLGKVLRFTRSHTTMKSKYDALVIGGGGFCSAFSVTADVEHLKFYNTFSLSWDLFLCVTCLNIVQRSGVVIIFIFTNSDPVKCSFFEGHNGLVAVSLKACMISSELQHYSSDGVGVHMSRPPTCRKEDWRRQYWNVGMFLGELLSQRKSFQVRWPICKRSDGLKSLILM